MGSISDIISDMCLIHICMYTCVCVCVCVCVCIYIYIYVYIWGFPGGSMVKNPPEKTGDACSIPELGRSPGEGNGNPLQYSWLGNPMDRRAGQATVHGVTKSWTQLSN